MKTEMIRARIEPELKAGAEDVFRLVGLTTTQAITIFFRQVVIHKGLPFPVRTANATTRRTASRTDAGEDLARYRNAAEMFEDLGL